MTLPFGENSISEGHRRRRLKGESKENLKPKGTGRLEWTERDSRRTKHGMAPK